MRSHYVEGSKTFSYEVAEQLDWQVPDQLIVPVGSGAMPVSYTHLTLPTKA